MDEGLLLPIGVVVAVLAALWVLPEWDRYRRRLLRAGRALHLVEEQPTPPFGRPIEQIAADVRRIGAQVHHAPRGMPVAKRRGWFEAYDDVLIAACHALQLAQRLREFPDGPQRDLERERVERMLQVAGLPLSPS